MISSTLDPAHDRRKRPPLPEFGSILIGAALILRGDSAQPPSTHSKRPASKPFVAIEVHFGSLPEPGFAIPYGTDQNVRHKPSLGQLNGQARQPEAARPQVVQLSRPNDWEAAPDIAGHETPRRHRVAHEFSSGIMPAPETRHTRLADLSTPEGTVAGELTADLSNSSPPAIADFPSVEMPKLRSANEGERSGRSGEQIPTMELKAAAPSDLVDAEQSVPPSQSSQPATLATSGTILDPLGVDRLPANQSLDSSTAGKLDLVEVVDHSVLAGGANTLLDLPVHAFGSVKSSIQTSQLVPRRDGSTSLAPDRRGGMVLHIPEPEFGKSQVPQPGYPDLHAAALVIPGPAFGIAGVDQLASDAAPSAERYDSAALISASGLPTGVAPSSLQADAARNRSFALGEDLFASSDTDGTKVFKAVHRGLLGYRDPTHFVGIAVEQAWFQPFGQATQSRTRVYVDVAQHLGTWQASARIGTDGHTIIGKANANNADWTHQFFIEREIIETPKGLNLGLYYTFFGTTFTLPLNEANTISTTVAVQKFSGENVRFHLRENYDLTLSHKLGLSAEFRLRYYHSTTPGEYDYYSPRNMFEIIPTLRLSHFSSRWSYDLQGGIGVQYATGTQPQRARYAHALVASPLSQGGWRIQAEMTYADNSITSSPQFGYVSAMLGITKAF